MMATLCMHNQLRLQNSKCAFVSPVCTYHIPANALLISCMESENAFFVPSPKWNYLSFSSWKPKILFVTTARRDNPGVFYTWFVSLSI
jgi:hypothetical protein